MTSRPVAAAVACVACTTAFVALGRWVTHHPLSRIDTWSAAIRGMNVPLAEILTNSGYASVLTALSVVTVAAAVAARASVTIPIFIIGSQLVSQLAVNVTKGWFQRARPDAWLYRHEPGYSYPSGHATTAVVFYGSWLVVIWTSGLPLPARVCAAAALAVWAAGIGWSRIVLSAHYATDVAGGYLFGLSWVALCLALAATRNAGALTRGR